MDPAGGSDYSLGSREPKRYYCSSISREGAMATFTNSGDELTDGKDVYYATYPYYSGQGIWSSGKMLQWVSEKQKVDPSGSMLPIRGNIGVSARTSQVKSAAKSDNKDGPFRFTTVTSLLKFNVPAADAGVITEIRARSMSYDLADGKKQALGLKEYLGGNFTIDYSSDTPSTSLCYWPHTQPYGATELGSSDDVYASLTGASYYPRIILYPKEGEGTVLAAGYGSNAEALKKGTDSYTLSDATSWGKFSGTSFANYGLYRSTGSANFYVQQGHIKLGTGSGQSYLVTPLLSAIPSGESATVRVEVTAAAYKDDRGRVTSGKLMTATGGTFSSAHVLEGPILSAPVTFSMTTNTVRISSSFH